MNREFAYGPAGALLRIRSAARWGVQHAEAMYRTADHGLRLLTSAHVTRTAALPGQDWQTLQIHAELDVGPLRIRGRWSNRDDEEQVVVPLAAVSLDSLTRFRVAVPSGLVITPDAVLRLVQLVERSEAILGARRAHEWLMTRHEALEGMPPLQLVYTERGGASVHDLLSRMEAVISPARAERASGRAEPQEDRRYDSGGPGSA